jgi:hypothetical protein
MENTDTDSPRQGWSVERQLKEETKRLKFELMTIHDALVDVENLIKLELPALEEALQTLDFWAFERNLEVEIRKLPFSTMNYLSAVEKTIEQLKSVEAELALNDEYDSYSWPSSG